MLCIVFPQTTCNHGQFHMELQTKQPLINYNWNIPCSQELHSAQTDQKKPKTSIFILLCVPASRNGVSPASVYISYFLSFIPHFVIPNSSRGAAACCTFIKARKHKFSFPSPLPEPAEPKRPLNKEQETAASLPMRSHKTHKLSYNIVPVQLLYGEWQE